MILGPWALLAAIVLATLVSEDLTCVGVGLLVAAGEADLFVGATGCFLGIWVGDLGLWLAGRLAGRGLLRWRWLARRFPEGRLEQTGRWLDHHGGALVLAARFLPGARLPLYVASGALGRRGGRFALWTGLAALIWAPLLVLAVAHFGEALAGPLRKLFGLGWPALLLAAATAYLALRAVRLLATRTGRARLAVALARLWRWEFWPAWLFYAPLVPWYLWLCLRYRGLTVWTAANPGLPAAGGVVGESKFATLEQLPPDRVIPSALLPAGAMGERLRALRRALEQPGWAFPLVLKPDAGQRGAGVKRVRDFLEAEKYLHAQPAAVLAQPYHPGPYEAGLFYYRLPGEEKGRLFSVTDKVFPAVAGDGRATLGELIWRHPRYRLQARAFLARHAAEVEHVLGEGERFALALAGNHCQGTMFLDGARLRTPALERAVDELARSVDGFFIGRFDVRYSDEEAFQAGRDLAVVELNGATAEATDLYDPSRSLIGAYRTLFRQWGLLFHIGAANRRRGHRPTPLPALLRLVFDYYRSRRVDLLAD
jgi:membrane protein DedA with SNARE-associated domain